MEKTLGFYFDFSCPYAYLASTQVEALAERAGAALEARPILLGGVFKARAVPQNLSATLSPEKARHNANDMRRAAQLFDVPLRMPDAHPMRTVEALRAVLAVGEPFMPLAHAFYRAYWVEGIDISTKAGLCEVLRREGHDPAAVLEAASKVATKADLRARTDRAIEDGVFGVPSFMVGKDLFWGQDRMDYVERALGTSVTAPPHEGATERLPVDFYFDFSSPFSYLGAHLMESTFGDHARWRPILLGAVFKAVGQHNVPLLSLSDAKRQHVAEDLNRQAAHVGASFRWPTRFPMKTVLALRVTMLANAHATAQGRQLVHALYRAYWVEDRDINDPTVVASIATECGHDGAVLVAAAGESEAKQALFQSTQQAVEAGVFGAPTTVVHTPEGPQLYWGADRVELAARAAAGDRMAW